VNLDHLRIKQAPISVGAMAEYAYDPLLEAQMLALTRYDGPVQLSKHVGDKLLVPRELPLSFKGTKDKRVSPKAEIAINCKYPPRNADQARILEESYQLLLKGKSHVLQASTGAGKTVLGVMLAAKLGLKTLVVVHKEDLMVQWRDAFKKFTHLTDGDIGTIQQGKCEVEGKQVSIGMIHSLSKEKYDESIYNAYGFLIVDEIHHLSAETFSIVAGLFNAKLRYGLSATPKRQDGKEFIFHAHVGPVAVTSTLITLPPKILVVKSNWKLPIVNWRINGSWVKIPLPHEAGKLGAVLVSLAKDQERNALIIRFAHQAYQKGRRTVVISDLARDKHLDALASLAVSAGIPETDIGFYVGGMKEKDLDISMGKKLIFATYGFIGEGTDIPWLDTAILATPRANITQATGRILREYPDKKEPVVVDIVDAASKILQGYYYARVKRYGDMGATMVQVK